ncbi:hypothetical protein NMY22_g4778 [Coprinellus aureogranulatus]|nr:hypothetical protein NMY22_g4778 [Coprinellus aureogranulatus]
MEVVNTSTDSTDSKTGGQESGVDRISDLPLDILREVPSFGSPLVADSYSDSSMLRDLQLVTPDGNSETCTDLQGVQEVPDEPQLGEGIRLVTGIGGYRSPPALSKGTI